MRRKLKTGAHKQVEDDFIYILMVVKEKIFIDKYLIYLGAWHWP